MKTTILITGLGTGGAERFLSKILPIKDVDVVSVTGLNSIGKELERKGVKVTYLNSGKNVKLFSTIKKLYKHLKGKDQLMTFLIHSDLLGRFVGKLLRMKVICNVRNDYSKITKLYLMDRFTRFLVDEYIVNSPALSSYMKKIKVKKYKVIPNGVDVEELEKARVLEGFEGKIITCVARLEAQKNHETLVKAMNHLKGCTLLLVGEGSRKEELENLVEDEGLTEKVKFLGNRSDVPSILKRTDVFVLPSKTEGMSNALLEAMALAKPCVVSNIPQNTALIKDGENGLTFKTNDYKDLAKKISQAKKSHGLKAKQTIKKEYDINKIKKQYEEIL